MDHPGGAVRGWWNGLLYSWYQLLACPELDGVLARGKRWRTSRGAMIVRLPDPGPILLDRVVRLRAMAVALTAVEARYLPVLDPEWLQLINADQDEWQRYRDGFDPVAASAQLGYLADRARQDAEWLLLRARSLDPVGDSWSQLMRRAPARAWKDLKDAALSALDYRIAAEILLLFCLLMLGGVDRDLEKVAALAAAPLIGQKAPSQNPAWLLIKPPTCLYIAVDPEGQYFAPANVPQTRTAILNEIRAVLRAQGVRAANPAEVEELVRICTCYCPAMQPGR